MPNPAKYKEKSKFMDDCMHQTVKEEGKSRDQGVAQCLSMWRKEKGDKNPKKKEATYNLLRVLAKRIAEYA